MAFDLEKLNIVITGDGTEAVATVDQLVDYLQGLKDVTDGMSNASNNMRGMFRGIQGGAKSAAKDVQNLSDALSGSESVAAEVQQGFSDVGISADEAHFGLKDFWHSITDGIPTMNLANTKLGSLFSSIKRIAMYRLIRTGIKMVTQAAREGLDILIEWDRAYGNNDSYAARTSDEIAAKWREVKKSIGAAAMPLIQLLEPALMAVLNGVISIANAINQVVRSAQGYSDYMKASYNSTKSAVGAAKELKRVLFGFDELNVLPSDSGSGASSTVSAIDYTPTDIISPWKQIGEALNRIWSKIGKDLDGQLGGWEKMFSGAGKIFMGIVTGDWSLVGEGLKEIFIGAWEVIIYGAKQAFDLVGELFSGFFFTIHDMFSQMHLGSLGIIETLKEDFNRAWRDTLVGWEEFKYNLVKAMPDWLATFLGIDKKAYEAQYTAKVKILTDTNLSPDTAKLLKLLDGMASGAVGGMSFNGTSVAYRAARFASGGDPVQGTFFYAGESGAEVVANTQGGTGVMNVQQMQQAVASGNMQVVSALGQMTSAIVGAINEKQTDLYIGEDAIGKAATRYMNGRSRATGVPALTR